MTDFLVVYEKGDSNVRVRLSDEPQIDRAVRKHIDTGCDVLVELTGIDGLPYKVRASRITGWTVSTEATRKFYRELEDEIKKERPAWDE